MDSSEHAIASLLAAHTPTLVRRLRAVVRSETDAEDAVQDAADIEEQKLDRVMVAACSPRMHEITFRKVLDRG
jgi:heterodisulfide reductase subunit A-like polyferredoxin